MSNKLVAKDITNNQFHHIESDNRELKVKDTALSGCIEDGKVKVDIEDATISGTGLATEPKQDDMITNLGTIAGDTTSIDGKISKGNSATGVGDELQQVLIYGKKTDGTLQPLETNGDRLLVDVLELSASGQITTSTALSSIQVCGYDTGTSQFKTVKVDGDGHLQVDVLSGAGGGDATSANQTTMITKLTDIDTNTTGILASHYQEGDTIGASDTGVLMMGRNGTNASKPIHITNNGDVEVEIADFVKGQATMANSFPVVIASDQSAITETNSADSLSKLTEIDNAVDAMSLKLPASLGAKATSNSLSVARSTTTGDWDLSARTTIATKGTSTKLLCNSSGELNVEQLRSHQQTTILETTAIPAEGNTTTSVFDLGQDIPLQELGQTFYISNSASVSLEIQPQVSPDNTNWYNIDNTAFVSNSTSALSREDGLLVPGSARYLRLVVNNTDTLTSTNVSIDVGYYN